MQAARVPLNEYEFPTTKLANVQAQLERLVEKNYYLHQSARDAYRAFLLSYNSHQLKSIFNVHRLDLAAVARSFGFGAPPKVPFMLSNAARLSVIQAELWHVTHCDPGSLNVPLLSIWHRPAINRVFS